MNRYVMAIATILCGAQFGHAADAVIDPPQEPALSAAAPRSTHALQITPYMWAAGLEGRISPFRRAPTIGIEKSFSDVLDELDFGGFVNIWGRYERLVFSGDVMYVSTTDSRAFSLRQGIAVTGSVDTKQFMATLQGGYRVLDTPDFTLDALAGARFWRISNDVTVSAIGMSGSYEESFGWADPVIGARAFLRLTEKLSLQAQADVGGFGAGSDLTWSVLATANYTITDHFSVSAGYKALDVDYDRGGHVYDTRLSGPVLGLTYRF